MRRVIALVLIVGLALALTAPAAEAHHAPLIVGVGAVVGFALAAPFIIAGSILAPLVHPPVYPYAAPYAAVQPPPAVAPQAVYAPAPYAAPPARPVQPVVVPASVRSQVTGQQQATTVQYPHGRYELRGDGVHTAYRWVWIPNAPPPPPPPGPTVNAGWQQ